MRFNDTKKSIAVILLAFVMLLSAGGCVGSPKQPDGGVTSLPTEIQDGTAIPGQTPGGVSPVIEATDETGSVPPETPGMTASAEPAATDEATATAEQSLSPDATTDSSPAATGEETPGNPGTPGADPTATAAATLTAAPQTSSPTAGPTATARPAVTATPTVKPTATAAPTPSGNDEADNVCGIWNEKTVSAFSNVSQSKISLTSDGVRLDLTQSGGPFNPKVRFDVAAYAKTAGRSAPEGGKSKYIVIKLKTLNTDGKFSVSNQSEKVKAVSAYLPDGSWTSVVVDMSDTKILSVSRLTTLDLNWSAISTKSGAYMIIREIAFYPDYESAMRGAGYEKYLLGSDPVSVSDPLANKTLKAADEDSSVSLWFDHSTEKTLRTTTKSSGLTGYTVRMAKNESENAQFFVSPGKAMKIRIVVDEFRNASGDTVPFELCYEYYHRVSGKLIPDALAPYTGAVEVAAKNSQGFVIRLTTSKTTKAGTYESVVHVYDDETGREVRRAPVAVKVWDFALTDETTLRTAFLLWPDYFKWGYGQQFSDEEKDPAKLTVRYYEFFLYKYRINLADVPGGPTSSTGNKYLSDPRTNTFRWYNVDMSVTEDNGGVAPSWRNKMIYYKVDEPGARNPIRTDLQNLKQQTDKVRQNTPDYRWVVPVDRNLDLDEDLNSTSFASSKYDMLGYMEQMINIWCPKLHAFTPRELAFIKDVSYFQSIDQDVKYGLFTDRVRAWVAGGDELWIYICNRCSLSDVQNEPYANWQLTSDGTETIISLWQIKQQNATGMLYWAVNYWKENFWNNSVNWIYPFPGDGVLVYSGDKFGTLDPIPTLRLEGIRDGIEDYQMLSMLEEIAGRKTVDDLISKISTSVVTYSKDDARLHAVRVMLGDMLEKALKG